MGVIGREGEVARVRGLRAGEVLVVTGEPGAGTSTLLELAARDRRALRACGAESEARLPFAGLHQLLAPVLDRTDELPAGRRNALLGAFGLVEPAEPDPMQLGLAVLSLLSGHELVIVDDAQWLDRASLQVVAFAARRATAPMLIGARADEPLPDLDGLPRLELGPLSQRDANRLLDALPQPPTGSRRLRVLAEAAGNPLALTELSAVESSPGPLPTAERLVKVFAARAAELPERTRAGLLLLAAADGWDTNGWDTEARDTDGWSAVRVEDLEPAARAGLVRWTGTGFRFRHPLVRSALYHSAPLPDRRRAHLELAGRLRAEPDRHAWHRAAAADGPDESVAAELERVASRARARGGFAAAACALQRAAELSPQRAERARRYGLAADSAVLTGQGGWVEELAGLVAARTDDPALQALAGLRAGQAMSVTGRHDAAFAQLMRVDDPEGKAMATAAVVAYQTGDPAQREQVRARLASITDPVTRAFTAVVTDPIGAAGTPLPAPGAGAGPGGEIAQGTVAWLLDEHPAALRLFERAAGRVRCRLPDELGCAFGWARFETGRWDPALSPADSVARAEPAQVRAGAMVLEASVCAVRGDTTAARRLAEQALTTFGSTGSGLVVVRARWALGMAAVAAGEHDEAYAQFRRMFAADGSPLHFHQSFPGLPELAVAAVRAGVGRRAASVVDAARRVLGAAGSPRLRALLARAEAAIAPDPEPFFRAAVEPRTVRWPFERARTLLEFAEWLRRQRRIAEAREPLAEALDDFRRLGAHPWVWRAEAELRAAGRGAAPSPSGLAQLSPQQQEIVRLAARGLTNREIGARLHLSPRTVGSHLYRTFPKLGVTSRAQLGELLAAG